MVPLLISRTAGKQGIQPTPGTPRAAKQQQDRDRLAEASCMPLHRRTGQHESTQRDMVCRPPSLRGDPIENEPASVNTSGSREEVLVDPWKTRLVTLFDHLLGVPLLAARQTSPIDCTRTIRGRRPTQRPPMPKMVGPTFPKNQCGLTTSAPRKHRGRRCLSTPTGKCGGGSTGPKLHQFR